MVDNETMYWFVMSQMHQLVCNLKLWTGSGVNGRYFIYNVAQSGVARMHRGSCTNLTLMRSTDCSPSFESRVSLGDRQKLALATLSFDHGAWFASSDIYYTLSTIDRHLEQCTHNDAWSFHRTWTCVDFSSSHRLFMPFAHNLEDDELLQGYVRTIRKVGFRQFACVT